MLRWREFPAKVVRKIALDNSNLQFLPELVHGFTHPIYDTLTFISDNSMLSNGSLYLSVDGRTRKDWIKSIENAPNVQLLPTITLKLAADMQSKKKPKTSNKNSKMHDAHVAITQTSYTNPHRELMRYMWQSVDYKCKNCNYVWPKHSVTVSWRETCVSMCLKGKKACKSRPEYERVNAGDLWITNKNVLGNGGTDLTPTPEKVLECEENNELVAVNPETLARDARRHGGRRHPAARQVGATASWPQCTSGRWRRTS